MDVIVSPKAISELDEICFYFAGAIDNFETADRLVESITSKFPLIGAVPELDLRRDRDLRPGIGSLAVGEYVLLYSVRNSEGFR